ncbi:conserved hypothetical protein [uncultured Desulfatiglans sp.]|uniref:CRISPR-associated protein, TM1812 family n=1 Tax=Uncultured Desulfatiglans sp. TaxID=1748965 RepID=A0A653A927_UNCDX|nr:conserved hypothetical protein [uncultured Desulfatiglans sp.]
MSGKKMISFLGTSAYKAGVYVFGGRSKETRFVQAALAAIFQPSEVVVFLTQGARERNWQSPSGSEGRDGDLRLKGLEDRVRIEVPSIRFRGRDIPDGSNEEEIWAIFQEILDEVEEGDEIIFDVTHSFRSIPILALACIQYLRTLKGVKLGGIYYGAWEARRDSADGGLPEVPVFDLTPFAALMDWSQAIAEFERSGSVEAMKVFIEEEVIPRRRESRGKDAEAVQLDELSKRLARLNDSVTTCRGKILYETDFVGDIRARVEELKRLPNTLPAFYPLLERLAAKLDLLVVDSPGLSEDIRRGLGAVNWCLHHGLVQQGYTLLTETILTYFCLKGGLDWVKMENRGDVSAVLNKIGRKEPLQGHVYGDSSSLADCRSRLPETLFLDYEKLARRRNDINHSEMKQDSAKADKLKKELGTFYTGFLDYLRSCS